MYIPTTQAIVNRRLLSEELIKKAKERVARKRPVAWLFPSSAEREYELALVQLFEKWFKEVEAIIDLYLPGIMSEVERMNPKNDSFTDNVKSMISSIKGVQFGYYLNAVKMISADVAKKVDLWNKKQFERVIHSVTGLNVAVTEMWKSGAVSAFIERNVSLITKVNDDMASKIETTVYNAISTGKKIATIKKEIVGTGIDKGVFGSTKKRALVIARDQVGKLNGEMVMKRQNSIGIKSYFWRTSVDERVRGNPTGRFPNAKPSHYSREGKKFYWDRPPEDGHPGTAIMCRCYAEPNIKEFIDNL